MSIVIHPTAVAQWQALITHAEQSLAIQLDENLESYLVFLLMRFINNPQGLSAPLAVEFLRANGLNNARSRCDALQGVGDKCLLMTGFFPQRSEKRNVNLGYFVDLGQMAYEQCAEADASTMGAVYHALCARFVSLMDILQRVRSENDAAQALTPLQAEELVREHHSQVAKGTLKNFTQGHVLFISEMSFGKPH